jgi:hypothetical protein
MLLWSCCTKTHKDTTTFLSGRRRIKQNPEPTEVHRWTRKAVDLCVFRSPLHCPIRCASARIVALRSRSTSSALAFVHHRGHPGNASGKCCISSTSRTSGPTSSVKAQEGAGVNGVRRSWLTPDNIIVRVWAFDPVAHVQNAFLRDLVCASPDGR